MALQIVSENSEAPVGDRSYRDPRTGYGVEFKPSDSGNLIKFTMNLKKIGSPGGVIIPYLFSHTGTFNLTGLPDTVLATGDSFTAANLTTSTAEIDFTFTGDQQYGLEANIPYFICICGPQLESQYWTSTNYCPISYNAANVSAQSTQIGSSYPPLSGTWSTQTFDLIYKVYADVTSSVSFTPKVIMF